MQVTEHLLISAGEAARMLSIGRSKFYSMCSTGELGPLPITFGTRKLWIVEELRAWVSADCPAREVWQKEKSERIKYANSMS